MKKKHEAQQFAERLLSILTEKRHWARERKAVTVIFILVVAFLTGYRLEILP